MRRLSMRSVGKLLVIVGLVGLTIGLPVYGWMVRNNADAFNKQVGWANIWAAAIGGAGVLLMLLDRGKTDKETHLRQVLFGIARAQRTKYGQELAQLLGTDILEARSARLQYCSADPRTGKAVRGARTLGSIEDIAHYYRRQNSGRMLILGPAGAGKTVLATTLALRLTEQFIESEGREVGSAVPTIFNLTAWPSKQDLVTWLTEELSLRFRVGTRAAKGLLEDGKILPVLDGLDEMDSEGGPRVRAEIAVEKINEFIAIGPSRSLIIIGRSDLKYYGRLRTRLRNVQAIMLRTLKISDVDTYLKDHCGRDTADAIKEALDSAPKATRTYFYTDTSTPWRLAMTAAYLNSGGDLERLLPLPAETISQYKDRRDVELYESFLEARIKHHGHRSGKERAVARSRLSAIAHLCSRTGGQSSGTDIVLHEWWRRFGRVHVIAWQSRFALAAALLPFGLPLDTPLPDYQPHPRAGWIGWAMPLSNFLMLAVIAMSTPYRAPSRPLRINLSVQEPRRLIRILLYIVCAVGVGYAYSTVAGMGAFLLFVVVTVLLDDATEDATSPQAPIRRDFFGCVLLGLAFGVFMGSYCAELMGTETGLTFGLGYFLVALAAFTSGRYFVATLLGPTIGIPLRFSTFLNWAASAGVLRVSGIGYQFRHRELMQYLVASSPAPNRAPIPGPLGIPIWRGSRWRRINTDDD